MYIEHVPVHVLNIHWVCVRQSIVELVIPLVTKLLYYMATCISLSGQGEQILYLIGCHLACLGLLAVPCKWEVFFFQVINPLLTKLVLSRWLDIGVIVLLGIFMDLNFVSVHKHVKKRTWPIFTHLDLMLDSRSGRISVQAWNFFRLKFHCCLSCVQTVMINYIFKFFSTAQIYDIHIFICILHHLRVYYELTMLPVLSYNIAW